MELQKYVINIENVTIIIKKKLIKNYKSSMKLRFLYGIAKI